jgi:hypothetical protein
MSHEEEYRGWRTLFRQASSAWFEKYPEFGKKTPARRQAFEDEIAFRRDREFLHDQLGYDS